jgi:hypothetical protein
MKKAQNKVKLSSSDRRRMTQLFEEVRGRLEEMSLVVGRNLKLNLATKELKFSPLAQPARKTGGATALVHQFKGITIVCSPDGCGCYDNDAGICFKC